MPEVFLYVEAPKKSIAREYTEAILIALLLALLIRTFIIQAFKIPSGSMENTLLIGDHILVSKFSYGTHIPNEIPFLDIKSFCFPKFRKEETSSFSNFLRMKGGILLNA